MLALSPRNMPNNRKSGAHDAMEFLFVMILLYFINLRDNSVITDFYLSWNLKNYECGVRKVTFHFILTPGIAPHFPITESICPFYKEVSETNSLLIDKNPKNVEFPWSLLRIWRKWTEASMKYPFHCYYLPKSREYNKLLIITTFIYLFIRTL